MECPDISKQCRNIDLELLDLQGLHSPRLAFMSEIRGTGGYIFRIIGRTSDGANADLAYVFAAGDRDFSGLSGQVRRCFRKVNNPGNTDCLALSSNCFIDDIRAILLMANCS